MKGKLCDRFGFGLQASQACATHHRVVTQLISCLSRVRKLASLFTAFSHPHGSAHEWQPILGRRFLGHLPEPHLTLRVGIISTFPRRPGPKLFFF